MTKGYIFAALLGTTTIALVVIGTVWPVPSAVAYAGGLSQIHSSSTPEAAVRNLANEIRDQAWGKAYASLANRAQFTEPALMHDLKGSYPSLLTYATLDNFEVRPLHASATEADVQLKLHWSTVVGTSVSTRELHMVKAGDRWEPEWPIVTH